ncbi:hypothetical protein ABT246_24870 [Streptomyces sp. NPDC001553]|uniref:hypothetical protein n=1 Tax=Streptomyces sp. NPDC001553 TaxID=3154385 RepID=UPI00332C3DCF
MPTLSSLLSAEPDFNLRFLRPAAAGHQTTRVTGLAAYSGRRVHGAGSELPPHEGSVVVFTDTLPIAARFKDLAGIESLLRRMAQHHCAALVLTATDKARFNLPSELCGLSDRLRIPLWVATASPEWWLGVNDRIQDRRGTHGECQAHHLTDLIHQLPAQLADMKATQRIVDRLSSVANVDVAVGDPDCVLAAAADATDERLAHAMIRRAIGDGDHAAGTGRVPSNCSCRAAVKNG